MRYEFPEIRTIDDVLPSIVGRPEFLVNHRDGFTYIDYAVNFADTFPPVANDNLLMLRRELRGIKFYPDGTLAGRPYHKFFNLNEREETQQHVIDWNEPFDLLDKMDGSMVHPIIINGQIVLCTKAGPTDVALQAHVYAMANPRYMDFCQAMIKTGYSPLFEWCSRKQRIVVDYPEDRLILCAIRHNLTGKYTSMPLVHKAAEVYNIPVVQAWSGGFVDIAAFTALAQARTGEEGYVIRFNSGHMLKVKNAWYCQIHSTKDEISREKNVIRMCLSQTMDDLLPRLLETDRERLVGFHDDLHARITQSGNRLRDKFNEYEQKISADLDPKAQQKLFAELVREDPERGFLFSIRRGVDPVVLLKEHVLSNTGTGTKVDSVRHFFGDLVWTEYD